MYGRIVRELDLEVEAEPGRSVNLTLDLALQKKTEALLEDRVGAIVAMDPRNGEILAMASKPDFDANALAANWNEIAEAPNQPFMNRAIMREYPPGSTFKIITATAALEERKINESGRFYCNGGFYLPNWSHEFRCHKRSGHGSMNIHEALVESCNVFFYNLAHKHGVTIPLMHKYEVAHKILDRIVTLLPQLRD